MANIGGVEIPDELMPTFLPPPARPGLGDLAKSSAKATYGQLRYGLPYQFETLAETIDPGDAEYYQQNLNRVAAEASKVAPASVSDLTSGRVGLGGFIAENLASSLPYMAGTVVGAIGGGLVGGPGGAVAGAVAGGVPQFSGSNVARAVEENGELGYDNAANAALIAPLQSAADAAIGRFLPGAGRVLGNVAATQSGNFLRRTATSIAKAGATEAVTEAAQQVGERYAAGLPVGTPDAAAEYVNAAVTALAVGGFLGAGGGFRRTPAVAKPAEQVTGEDLDKHIDTILGLPAPAGAAAETLALPSPQMFGREPGGPILESGQPIVQDQRPTQQLTDFLVDSQGNAAPSLDELMINRNQPQQLANTFLGNLTPEVQALFDQTAQPGPSPLAASTALSGSMPVGADLSPQRVTPPPPFETQLAEAKKGLRGGFVQNVTAADRTELVGKVYDQIFTEQDTRANTVKFAQRLGILDDNLEPTALAQQIEAQRAGVIPEQQAPAPVEADPGFAAEWEQLKTDAGVTRVRSGKGVLEMVPANRQQAEAQIMDALANVDAFVAPKDDQVEAVAKKLGLLTDDDFMDITPKGREAFLRTPTGQEEIVKAGMQQGFEGAQASIFDRGAQAAVLGGRPQTEFADFTEMAAYEAGKAWGQDFVQTAQVPTAAQSQRTAARAAGQAVERTQLSPEQVQQRGLNRLLDAADLAAANDGDRAELYRMVREGKSAADIGAALEKVQRGESLFTQPPRTQREAQDVAARATRGQPLFREMNDRQTFSKQEAKRQSVKNLLIEDVQTAFESGDLTGAERIAAVAEITRGEYKKVVDRLSKSSGVLPSLAKVSPAESFEGQVILRLARELRTSKPILEALAEVPTEIGDMARKLLKAGGNDVPVTIVTDERMWAEADPEGEFSPQERLETKIEGLYNPNDDRIYLHEDMVRAGTFLHEYAHALTARHIEGRTQIGREITKIYEMFQAARPDDGSYGFTSPHEFVAEIYGNRGFRKLLQETQATGGVKPVSFWDKIVDILRRVFGKVQPDFVQKVMDLTDAAAKIQVPGDGPELSQQAALRMEARTIDTTNETAKGYAAMLTGALDRVNSADMQVGRRRAMLGWLSSNHLERLYGAINPGVALRNEAHRTQGAINSRMQHIGDEVIQQRFEQLAARNPKAADWVVELMDLTTSMQIDPDKPLLDHEHLGFTKDENGAATIRKGREADAARAREAYKQVTKLKNDLSRGDQEGIKLYNDMRALNEMQNNMRLAANLYSSVALDRELALGVEDAAINPFDRFMRADGLDTPTKLRDESRRILNRQIELIQAFIDAKKGTAAQGTDSDLAGMAQHLSTIEAQIGATREAMAAMQKAPYFHLGRFGDYFGTAVIRSKDGVADPKAVAHVAKALQDAGFDDAQISTDNTRPRIALRFDTVDQTDRFDRLMLDLKRQGWLDAEAKIKSGPRAEADNFGAADGMPSFVARQIEAIKANPMFAPPEGATAEDKAALAARRDEMVRLVLDSWLETQPDSAISKVLVHRKTVQGYSKDMIRNFAHRWRVGSLNLAKLASAPKFNDAYEALRAQAEMSLDAEAADRGDRFLARDLLNEVSKRDAAVPFDEAVTTFDKLRAYSHAYFLGMSPAYAIINMTQLGVTALPELAKGHGYSKAFHAMRRATPTVLRIMKAAGAVAMEGGWKRAADVSVTDAVLKRANLSDAERNFVQHMLASGSIDIGTAARALGQIAEGRGDSKREVALRYAAMFGAYTETGSRLLVALASRDLHGDKAGAEQYATKVISNSMFDYQNWNTARQLGKKGLLGPVTPIVTQFMSYSVQLLEKLTSEMIDARGAQRPGETAEAAKQRKQEARRFLAGHLTAVTALAGTMGLPFATVFATVLERLVDAFDDDDEPYDANAAWRGFLADVLGQDFGEVVARGLPRALGFDISTRAGEQSIIPGSEFFADRRPWKDAIAASTGRSIGAVPSMLVNVLTGAEKLTDGDVIGAAKEAMPIAFKGPIEAYRMAEEGYVDTKGNRLPMSPGATALLWQLMGFSPAEKAEYSEARWDQQSRRGEIGREANKLRQGIVKAMVSGDTERARELIADAQEFDANNPNFAVIPSLQGAISRRAQSRARAQALQSPIGVAPDDLAGQRLTRYANIDYVGQ